MLLFYHIVSVPSFFIPFLFFSTLYWQISWNGWQCQHTLGLCSLLTRAVFKGLTSEILVWCLCTAIYIHFVLYLCMDWFCRSVWKRRSRSEQSFEMCICLWQSLISLSWHSVVGRALKSICQPCLLFGQGLIKLDNAALSQLAFFREGYSDLPWVSKHICDTMKCTKSKMNFQEVVV